MGRHGLDVTLELLEPPLEARVRPLAELRVAHADEDVAVPGHHALADRPLGSPPDHERRPELRLVGGEQVADVENAVRHLTRLLDLAEVEELDLAPQDLGPAEELADDVERVLDRVLPLLVGAVDVVLPQEVLPQDVEEARLELEGSRHERLAV